MNNSLEAHPLDDLRLIPNQTKVHLFSQDIWELKELGFKESEMSSAGKRINFTGLRHTWLIALMKDTVWRKRNAVGTNTLLAYVRNLKSLVEFTSTHYPNFKVEHLNSELFERYFHWLKSKSHGTQRAYFSGFNELLECWQDWGVIPKGMPILPRELRPRQGKKNNPRSLSLAVQQQLIHAVTPPTDYFKRMVLLMFEIGARGKEVLNLRLDCLHKDKTGWYITRDNLKFLKEHTIPISDTLAEIITMQVKATKSLEEKQGLSNPNSLLFAHRKGDKLVGYTLRHINTKLAKFCRAIDLMDELGQEVSVSTHQFRHTVGTNLINSGVSQYHVQKFLGHESSTMTMVYAQIHDSTMRQALMSSSKLTDIQGRLYSVIDVASEIDEQPLDSASLDAQWLRRHISTQTLPNGVCALPIRQTCPHANACLACPSFRTGTDHLLLHKEHLRRTEALVCSAERQGLVRQAELNTGVIKNLNIIIGALENGE